MKKSHILHLAWMQALENHRDVMECWLKREVSKKELRQAWAEFQEIDRLLDAARREELEAMQ